MTRRSTIWVAAAALYTALNVGGAAFAIVMAEPLHAGVHVALLFVGAGIWSSFGPRRRERSLLGASSGDLTNRFRNLEQSIDAVAIEVERIGEGQRLMTNLLVDRDAPAPSGGSAPEAKDVEPNRSS